MDQYGLVCPQGTDTGAPAPVSWEVQVQERLKGMLWIFVFITDVCEQIGGGVTLVTKWLEAVWMGIATKVMA